MADGIVYHAFWQSAHIIVQLFEKACVEQITYWLVSFPIFGVETQSVVCCHVHWLPKWPHMDTVMVSEVVAGLA